MKVIGYGRISQTKTGEDSVSLAVQALDYEAWCTTRGFTSDGWYEDANVSGTKASRPGLDAALTACDGHTIVVRDLSRLGRTVALLARLSEMMSDGSLAGIETTHGQTIGTGYQGRQMLGLMLVIGQAEADAASERGQRRKEWNRQNGRRNGTGRRNYGLEDDLVTVREDEATHVREGVKFLLSGGSISGLATRWNSNGVPSASGVKWSYQVVRELYLAPRMAGLVLSPTAGLLPGPATALLDRDTWETVCSVITDRTGKPEGRSSILARYLTSVLVCGLCGVPLTSHSGARGPRYACVRPQGCRKTWLDAPQAEDIVARFFRAMSMDEGPYDATAALSALHADRKALTARSEELDHERFVKGSMPEKRYRPLRAALDKELDASALTIRSHSASAALSAGIESWDLIDAEQRRAAVLDLLGRAVVHPGRGVRKRLVWEQAHTQKWWTLWLGNGEPEG